MSTEIPRSPFQPLEDRLSGRAAEEVLTKQVSPALAGFLRQWVERTFLGDTGSLCRRVALKLKLQPHRSGVVTPEDLHYVPDPELPRLVDAIAQLHPVLPHLEEWEISEALFEGKPASSPVLHHFMDLEEILTDAGFYLRFDFFERHLVRRVNDTAQAAFDQAVDRTSTSAALHLRNAWAAAYGLEPDPNKAYHEAILAVEAVLKPITIPKDKQGGTLPKALSALGQKPEKWELAIGDPTTQAENIQRFRAMGDLLMKNHNSRHTGDSERVQDQREVEAVVHLAVLLVQWVESGVLRWVEE